MSDFLPKGYEVPTSGGKYTKFVQGDNRFRILSSPILGWEYWVREDGTVKVSGDKSMKGDRPKRLRLTDPRPSNVTDPTSYKHFWAMVVYNYQTKEIEILQVNQKGIQTAIRSFANDKDWGDPKNYDIVVSRSGEGFETEYQVFPKPPTKLDEGALQLYKDLDINLEALFEGKDPFNSSDQNSAEAVAATVPF